MEKSIDVNIRFCPECKKLVPSILNYCGECGNHVREQEIIICMEGDEITRVLKK